MVGLISAGRAHLVAVMCVLIQAGIHANTDR
jgi:hypothetical protein